MRVARRLKTEETTCEGVFNSLFEGLEYIDCVTVQRPVTSVDY